VTVTVGKPSSAKSAKKITPSKQTLRGLDDCPMGSPALSCSGPDSTRPFFFLPGIAAIGLTIFWVFMPKTGQAEA
jgi:hypothetical protein